ncbi:hypothetical protein ONZ45_g10302 [Pleurotus djamor]|nr:hypothetical protein ONZ45_g10302 [Pleurotus djamor]
MPRHTSKLPQPPRSTRSSSRLSSKEASKEAKVKATKAKATAKAMSQDNPTPGKAQQPGRKRGRPSSPSTLDVSHRVKKHKSVSSKSSTRVLPPVVPSDSESSDDSKSESSEDSEDNSESDGDLRGLDAEALRSQFRDESVTVARRPSSDSELEDIDTTRSQSAHVHQDSESDDPKEEEFKEAKPSLFLSDDDDDDDEDLYTKVAAKSRRSESSRDKARRLEQPRFQDAKPKTPGSRSRQIHHSPSRTSRSHSASPRSPRDVNDGWESEAHYEPIGPMSRSLSLKHQPTAFRETLQAAICFVTGDLAFDTAYPDTSVERHVKYHRQALIKCATSLGYTQLTRRFQKDTELVKLAATVLSSRFSKARTDCKEVTDAQIEGFYLGTTPPNQVKERLAFLINDMNYIYPISTGNGPQALDTKRPYWHPAIIASLKHTFFLRDRGSIVNNHSARFKSSISDAPGNTQLEVPIAMVCLVSTMIHASLQLRKDPVAGGTKATAFKADEFEDVYRGHQMFLQDLQRTRLKRFHELMHGLYNLLCTSTSTSAVTMSQRAMARLGPVEEDED